MGCENARFLGAERAHPDGVDTEQLEMVEVVKDSAEVAATVAVAVGEAGVDLVDHRGLPPVVPGDGARVYALWTSGCRSAGGTDQSVGEDGPRAVQLALPVRPVVAAGTVEVEGGSGAQLCEARSKGDVLGV
jgi:hypothetical protein